MGMVARSWSVVGRTNTRIGMILRPPRCIRLVINKEVLMIDQKEEGRKKRVKGRLKYSL